MLIAALLLLAGAQDAPAAAKPEQDADGTRRWSILVDPCASARTGPEQIVVCGDVASNPRLPLPAERGPPDHPMPSNPDLSGAGALAATNAPCGTRMGGCATGIDLFGGGTALVRLVGKVIDPDSCCERPGEATNPVMLVGDAVSAVGKVFKKKPDKSKRVPIVLDEPGGTAPVAPGAAHTP